MFTETTTKYREAIENLPDDKKQEVWEWLCSAMEWGKDPEWRDINLIGILNYADHIMTGEILKDKEAAKDALIDHAINFSQDIFR